MVPPVKDEQKHQENSATVTAEQRGSFTAALLVEFSEVVHPTAN